MRCDLFDTSSLQFVYLFQSRNRDSFTSCPCEITNTEQNNITNEWVVQGGIFHQIPEDMMNETPLYDGN